MLFVVLSSVLPLPWTLRWLHFRPEIRTCRTAFARCGLLGNGCNLMGGWDSACDECIVPDSQASVFFPSLFPPLHHSVLKCIDQKYFPVNISKGSYLGKKITNHFGRS